MVAANDRTSPAWTTSRGGPPSRAFSASKAEHREEGQGAGGKGAGPWGPMVPPPSGFSRRKERNEWEDGESPPRGSGPLQIRRTAVVGCVRRSERRKERGDDDRTAE